MKAAPDLRLGLDMLGSVYLGGFSFADLARAGRVEELRDGGLARADALFATDRPAVPRGLLTPFDPATTVPDTRRTRIRPPSLLVLAVLVTVTACVARADQAGRRRLLHE